MVAHGDFLWIGEGFGEGGFPLGIGVVYQYARNSLPGDVDMDGDVDLTDFAALKDNFGEEVLSRDAGDVTGDLQVTLDDFEQLKTNFGNIQTAEVPEPTTWATTVIGLIMLGMSVHLRRRSEIA